MKLLAPIAAVIAAASAGQIYAGQSAESYANSAELYQSALENQQHGLYSAQSQAPQAYSAHETYNSRPTGEKIAKILNYKSEDNGHQYQYAFETENGIHTQENGKTSEHGSAAHGAYSYTGDDGKVYTVTYTADENGFHPQGDHLPTPPPIPEEILKSLEQNGRDEAAGITDDGKYRLESGHSSGQGSAYGASNGYEQYNGRYQNLGYQSSSGHESAADLAYRGQAGQAGGANLAYYSQAGQDSGAKLAYYGQEGQDSGAKLAYRGQIGQTSGGKLAYRGQSSQASGAYLGHGSKAEQAYNRLSSQVGGASSGGQAYQGYSGNGGQESLGKIVVGYGSGNDAELGYAKH